MPGVIKYRLKQVDYSGTYAYSNEIDVDLNSPLTFSLSQNYPNPFNPSTKIKYSIPADGTSLMKSVQLKIYDILGREVATLVNEDQKPGTYEIRFNPETNIKNPPSGIYFYQLKAGNNIQTKKMLLLK